MLFTKLIEKKFVIEGIHCNKCKARAEEALKTIDDVKKVNVDVATGKTVLKSKTAIDEQIIKEKLVELGYNPVFE